MSEKSVVFHDGEKDIQTRVGVRQDLEYWGHRAIRPFFPEQHRIFFSQLPFIVLSARDEQGLPWVTLLTHNNSEQWKNANDASMLQPFISSPEETSLHFAASAIKGDALENAFVDGAEIGLIGIELESRRRNRANGVLSNVSHNSMTFDVTQSFGNCPQYISERILQSVEVDPHQINTSRHQCLTPYMKDWIKQSDTLFIGSGYQKPTSIDNDNISYGMDASHRGGSAGFVSIVDDNKLVLPDYAGNNFFNTIGNLIKDPRVGLLFIDFETGSLLQISGRATIDWDLQEVKKHAGAHRLIIIEIDKIVQLDNVLPLRWHLPSGIENGLEVISKTKESDDVISFELAARHLSKDDKTPLPTFRAGQHLPISLTINTASNDSLGTRPQKIERTYSLSNSPFDHHYRISVKRESQGIASQYLHDHIQVGDVIEAQKPKGDFLIKFPTRPVVLISAGIGATPIMSMLHSLVTMNMTSTIHVAYAARHGANAPLLSEMREVQQRYSNVNLAIAFSQPNSKDVLGIDYNKAGRIDELFLKEHIADFSANFYICGPTNFLTTVLSSLEALGVERHFMHFESF